ncbi:MAG TPA: hypothetical protein ENJ79_03080 [Gammaproteobacteria bacterium]|nr:hypothetical protein [Gammaproteobacteria bacterium]
MNEQDKAFVVHARRVLDAHAGSLDELTAARLAAARRRALDAAPARAPHWLPVAAFSALTACVLTLALLLNPESDLPLADPEVLEVIAQGEDIELIEELEFYQWLEVQERG